MKITHHQIGRHAIEVWAPPTLSPTTPLLVMHDGKNVFNTETSTVGVTWGVVEAVEREIAPTHPELQPLIVAVWVPDESRRFQELAPQAVMERYPQIWDEIGGPTVSWAINDHTLRGDAYQEVLASKVVPWAREAFGITASRERTAVCGSSMGALASLYALARHPETWGSALALSTHLPLGDGLMGAGLVDLLPPPGRHRIWMDYGDQTLDAAYAPYQARFDADLAARGWQYGTDVLTTPFLGHDHSERAWSARIHLVLQWWLNGLG
jgi:predicted alpha/beta superfamily hydrolase